MIGCDSSCDVGFETINLDINETRMDLNKAYRHDVETRLRGIVWVIAIFFVVVAARLFYLQILKGDYYRIFSENNVIKNIEVPAERGVIFDRKGRVVVDNRPVFNVVMTPQYVTDPGMMARHLASIVDLPEDELLSRVQSIMKGVQYRPQLLFEDVDMDTVAQIRAQKMPIENEVAPLLDGVDIQYQYVREYPEGALAPHLLGYVREVDAKRLERLRSKFSDRYEEGDHIGIGGVEGRYDHLIRGEEGWEQKIVDALGREVHYSGISIDLMNQPPDGGGNVTLTIDNDLQRKAVEMLAGRPGAVVAIDPRSGAIRALVSSPGYDMSRFYIETRNSYWQELLSHEHRPLFNRTIQGTYPPASTYKIVTAIAGLEEGVANPDEKIDCKGGLHLGDRIFGCWRRSGHGKVNLSEAIERSCDVYFYVVAERLGIDRLARYAKLFGLGNRTGLELPGEKGGLVPTTEWKMRRFKRAWNKGETLSAGIGQGYNLTTPLQVAFLGAQIANNGYRVQPYIVEKIETSDGNRLYEWEVRRENLTMISKRALDLVRE